MDIVEAPSPLAAWSEDQLRTEASWYETDCYLAGEPGHCPPDQASWRFEASLDLQPFLHLFGDLDGWRAWFEEELQADEAEALGRYWKDLLEEPIREEVIVLLRQGKGYIWSGWHRIAACLLTGRSTLKAIVGQPY